MIGARKPVDDARSIYMLYFKHPGVPTIVAKRPGKCKLGQRNGFSDTDIRKLNTLYQCQGLPMTGQSLITTQPRPTQKPWTQQKKCVDQNK